MSAVQMKYVDKPMSNDVRAVLAFIRDHPGHQPTEIAKRLGIESNSVEKAVLELLRLGLVVGHSEPKNFSLYPV